MKPRYKKNRIKTEVNLASQTHHVPHIGLPHSDPVASARKVKVAPIGAVAFATICATRCRQINAAALEKAMTV